MKTTRADELPAGGVAWPGALWRRLADWWPAVRLHRAPKALRVIETMQLGERRQLLLVSLGTRQLLIGAAANSLSLLAELEPKGEEVAGNE